MYIVNQCFDESESNSAYGYLLIETLKHFKNSHFFRFHLSIAHTVAYCIYKLCETHYLITENFETVWILLSFLMFVLFFDFIILFIFSTAIDIDTLLFHIFFTLF